MALSSGTTVSLSLFFHLHAFYRSLNQTMRGVLTYPFPIVCTFRHLVPACGRTLQRDGCLGVQHCVWYCFAEDCVRKSL